MDVTEDQILAAVQALSEAERLRLIERIAHELAGAREGDSSPATSASLIGLWAADAELVDELIEGIWTGRERRVLRIING